MNRNNRPDPSEDSDGNAESGASNEERVAFTPSSTSRVNSNIGSHHDDEAERFLSHTTHVGQEQEQELASDTSVDTSGQTSNLSPPNVEDIQFDEANQAVKSENQSLAPSLNERRSKMLAQFEQDLLAKMQVQGGASPIENDHDNQDPQSLPHEWNDNQNQDIFGNSNIQTPHHQGLPVDQENSLRLIRATDHDDDGNGAGTVAADNDNDDAEIAHDTTLANLQEDMTVCSASSAPGDVENVIPFARHHDRHNDAVSSSTSAPGDLENVILSTRWHDTGTLGVPPTSSPSNPTDDVAVAVARDDADDDDGLPRATSPIDKRKVPFFKTTQFKVWLAIGIVILIVVSVAAVLFAPKAPAPSNNMSSGKSLSEREAGLFSSFVSLLGEESLSEGSIAYQAALWIINDDPMNITVEDDNLLQRFLLAFFHISTTQEKPWKACNPPNATDSDVCFLMKPLYFNSDKVLVYGNETSNRWMSSQHECNWAGITCDSFNLVRIIDLPGQEIKGTIPTELILLSNLIAVVLFRNELYGTLPSELATMTYMVALELHFNMFTGSVPPQWYENAQLKLLNIGGNFLTGTLPPEDLTKLSSLEGLHAFGNLFTGTLPTEIGVLTTLGMSFSSLLVIFNCCCCPVQELMHKCSFFLEFYRLHDNLLTGTVPTEHGNLVRLEEMLMASNLFTGTLPSEIGKLTRLGMLSYDFNRLSGTIPDEYYNLSSLIWWYLCGMNLTGTISSRIGNLTSLESLYIPFNHFHGTIPTEIGSLTSLTTLSIEGNDLTGSVPVEICSLRSSDSLSTLKADCYSSNDNVPALIECITECCTQCCDSATGFCISYP